MEAIGEVLKAERERRGLSLEDVHDSTRITVQNLAALEQDRFDAFPNRVYARAFLRDYANFLGLDSGDLLARYEEVWNAVQEAPAPPPAASMWRTVGAFALTLVILAALSAAGYFGWEAYGRKPRVTPIARRAANHRHEGRVATLPKPVAPPQPEATSEQKPAPKPPAAAKPGTEEKPEVVQDKVTLELTASGVVWALVKTDGTTSFVGMLPKGQTKSFEGKKAIYVRVGRPGAAQIKVNGEVQQPLGPPGAAAEKTFYPPKPADSTQPRSPSAEE